jgi:hypothetical protein
LDRPDGSQVIYERTNPRFHRGVSQGQVKGNGVNQNEAQVDKFALQDAIKSCPRAPGTGE